jgi:hypothetical protein
MKNLITIVLGLISTLTLAQENIPADQIGIAGVMLESKRVVEYEPITYMQTDFTIFTYNTEDKSIAGIGIIPVTEDGSDWERFTDEEFFKLKKYLEDQYGVTLNYVEENNPTGKGFYAYRANEYYITIIIDEHDPNMDKPYRVGVYLYSQKVYERYLKERG